jgi:hypothetical protein
MHFDGDRRLDLILTNRDWHDNAKNAYKVALNVSRSFGPYTILDCGTKDIGNGFFSDWVGDPKPRDFDGDGRAYAALFDGSDYGGAIYLDAEGAFHCDAGGPDALPVVARNFIMVDLNGDGLLDKVDIVDHRVYWNTGVVQSGTLASRRVPS